MTFDSYEQPVSSIFSTLLVCGIEQAEHLNEMESQQADAHMGGETCRIDEGNSHSQGVGEKHYLTPISSALF